MRTDTLERSVTVLAVYCGDIFSKVRGVIIFERIRQVLWHSSSLCIAANGGLQEHVEEGIVICSA